MIHVSLKIKKRKSVVSGKPTYLFIQLIALCKPKQISLDFHLYPNEWEAASETVIIPPDSTSERIHYLLEVIEGIKKVRQTVSQIIKEQENRSTCTVHTIAAAYKTLKNSTLFNSYMKQQIAILKQNEQESTRHNYKSLQNSFNDFLNKRNDKGIPTDASNFSLHDITPSLVKEYETFLYDKKIMPNSVAFYTRTLRAVLNKAIREDLIKKQPFFVNVNTRIEKTKKLSVTEDVIHKIEQLPEKHTSKPGIALARDLFLFSYYTRGITFIDIAFLTRNNIQNGVLVYKRKKTGQELRVKILPEMQELIDRYHSENSIFLFPILKTPEPKKKEYESALRLQNLNLDRIGEIVQASLSTYVPRHTWASVAYSKGVPIELIAQALGHTSIKTTLIYIATLNNPKLDKVNEFVVTGRGQDMDLFMSNSVSW